MNKLVVTKLQYLHFGFSLSRSNWTSLNAKPTLRMLNNSLIRRHGISCCRVSVSGAIEATTSYSRTPVWTRPQKSYPSFQSRQRYPTIRSGHANGDKTNSASGYRQTTDDQNCSRNPLESWKLWQTENCKVEDIARRRCLTELEVYEQICECVQQGKLIDWFDLCQEAGFSPVTVLDINHAKAEVNVAMNETLGQQLDEFGRVPIQCGPHVTDVHVLLYNTMMACGITPHVMFLSPPEEQLIQIPQKMEAPKKIPTTSKAAATELKKVASGGGTASGSRLPNVKPPASEKNPLTEGDTNKAPKRLTQKHMLQWMADRNGVTLMELVLEFQGYNECQLMRLILLLERKKLIQLGQGIFRVTTPDKESTM